MLGIVITCYGLTLTFFVSTRDLLLNWLTQDTNNWLKGDDGKSTVDQAQNGPATPEKPGGIPWREAKTDASWNSPEKEQPELLDDYGYDNVFDDVSCGEWTVAGSKRKKKGKQVARPGNAPRGRGPRRM